MGRIAPDILEEIKDRVDIVQLISQYLPLKRAGRNFKALCPFHTEKTPSFTVSPEKQFFHCFGCGASGDIFQFLMRMENVTFPEALERLAEQAGVEIPRGRGEDSGEERDRLYHLHREAADYFHEVLLSSSGKKAREVAMSRGLDSSAIEAFRLGYAPDSWDRLREALKSKGFTTAEMLSVGLLGEREGGGEPYVKFRHRLMIPIWDSRGRVVAFGGRALDPEQEPKYLNSPEHLL
ncbi:MAG: DNA primase, partial [Aquificota bacterium]